MIVIEGEQEETTSEKGKIVQPEMQGNANHVRMFN